MLNYLSYGIKIWTALSSVLSQFTRVTDGRTNGRTDRILIAIPRLHYMQRGKKGELIETQCICICKVSCESVRYQYCISWSTWPLS